MASNPKYGVTYKTADGKTKTISGINLGTGSYSDEQITAFIGILATATNKEVLSVDVTTANAIPAPEPAPPQRDLITALTVEPAEVTITAGNSGTAEILITTDPEDAVYSLSAPTAPDWILIDDTTLVYTPAATTAAGDYQITVHAATNGDQKETFSKVIIEEKEKAIPNFGLRKSISLNDYDDKGGTATDKITISSYKENENEWTMTTSNTNYISSLSSSGNYTIKGYYSKTIPSTRVDATINATDDYKGVELRWSISKNSGTNLINRTTPTIIKTFD